MPMLHDANSTTGSDSAALNSQPRLAFAVYGTPAPQGSKRLVNGRMIEASSRVKPWRAAVRKAALEAMNANPGWDVTTEHVVLYVTFTLARPVAHHRVVGKERSPLLHTWAPTWHSTTPDLDKLLRSTMDALTSAGAYADDRRVCRVVAGKVYPTSTGLPVGALDQPGARIVLSGLGR